MNDHTQPNLLARLEAANPIDAVTISRLDQGRPELAEVLFRGEAVASSQARVRPGKTTRRRLTLAIVAIVLIAIALATPAFGLGERLLGIFSGSPVDPAKVAPRELHVMSAMTHGVSPRLPASAQENAARFQVALWRQLTARDGRVYFAGRAENGGTCVAIGNKGDSHLFGSITCVADFPSSARPLLDESAWSGPGPDASIVRFEGFAADGVARTALLMADGSLAAATPVEDNVYFRADGLPTEPASGIVALDENSTVLYTSCMARAGCPRPQ
jgi:hypothetical protein